jgi:hypothetical protein
MRKIPKRADLIKLVFTTDLCHFYFKFRLLADSVIRLYVCVRSESDVPARGDLQEVLDDGLDALLDEYDALDRGFKRRERLDVKKPGPYFSTNNYAFRRSETRDEQDSKQASVT